MYRVKDWTHARARNVAMRMAPKVLSIGGSESTRGSGLEGMAGDMVKRTGRCRDGRWVLIDGLCRSTDLTVVMDQSDGKIGWQEA